MEKAGPAGNGKSSLKWETRGEMEVESWPWNLGLPYFQTIQIWWTWGWNIAIWELNKIYYVDIIYMCTYVYIYIYVYSYLHVYICKYIYICSMWIEKKHANPSLHHGYPLSSGPLEVYHCAYQMISAQAPQAQYTFLVLHTSQLYPIVPIINITNEPSRCQFS